MYPYKIFTWTVDQAEIAPQLGIDFHQKWPYAPYHQMIAALQHAARDAALFLCLAALTVLLLGIEPHLGRLALLAGLFALPYWVLMAGGAPLPDSVLPAQFAEAQVRALPWLALLPLALALFILRGHSWPVRVLVTLLMFLLIIGHPLLELQPDEQKRKAIQSAAQIGLVGYACALVLFAVGRMGFRHWRARQFAAETMGSTKTVQSQNQFFHSPLISTARVILILILLGPVGIGINRLSALHLSDRHPVLPGPPGARMEPRPAPRDPVLGTIPLIDGKVTSVSFAKSAKGDTEEKFQYGSRFRKNEVWYMNAVIAVEYPPLIQDHQVRSDFVFYHDGIVFASSTADSSLLVGETFHRLIVSFGFDEPGLFPTGQYYFEVMTEGALIANGSFVIDE